MTAAADPPSYTVAVLLRAIAAGAEVRGPCPRGWREVIRRNGLALHASPRVWEEAQAHQAGKAGRSKSP